MYRWTKRGDSYEQSCNKRSFKLWDGIFTRWDKKTSIWNTRKRDYNSTILYNRQEGLKEGLEKGLKEGLKKGAEDKAIEIALKMLENGSDVNFIADVTGLSVEKINEIKK